MRSADPNDRPIPGSIASEQRPARHAVLTIHAGGAKQFDGCDSRNAAFALSQQLKRLYPSATVFVCEEARS